ncbi:SUMF1/EgtB/PvdO family nonheme iron enzyme [Teichococcus oryzae]|uniref:SUMF1/EgtB/PvdO family nonheme iron enzyme n=1 Tax=Teichococcus oryzae TaxID=1608942 RepID=UPI0019D5410A
MPTYGATTSLRRSRLLANTWQGEFPWQNLGTDGYEGTSPVGAFPANGYGLFDMARNVREWTCEVFQPRHTAETTKARCASRVGCPSWGFTSTGR